MTTLETVDGKVEQTLQPLSNEELFSRRIAEGVASGILGQVKGLLVNDSDKGVIIRGRTGSYDNKKTVTEIAREFFGLKRLILNEIEVSRTK